MKFKIEFNCDTEPFECDVYREISMILRDVAVRVENQADDGKVNDVNGNTIGQWSLTGY